MVSPDVTVSQQQEECTLKCPDEAPCRMGHADFSDRVVELGETHLNGMHCDCPVGTYLSVRRVGVCVCILLATNVTGFDIAEYGKSNNV